MPRKKMPVSLLANTTKRKYSQEQLNERQENEEMVKKSFNNANKIEKKVIKDLDKVEKVFFNEIKNIMDNTGTYTAVDSITISSLASTMVILLEARLIVKRDGLMVDFKPHPLLKTITQYTTQQTQLFKELSLSISERDRLAQMTVDGDFEVSELQNLDVLMNDFFKEGA